MSPKSGSSLGKEGTEGMACGRTNKTSLMLRKERQGSAILIFVQFVINNVV